MTSGDPPERYRSAGVLARGPGAVVHAAHDRALDRMVALKLASGTRGAADATREASSLARVDSPHVVTCLDHAGDPPYLVLQLVRGPDLGALLARHGPLPGRLAAQIGRDVAEGLRDLHRAGVAHGALTAEHVLVRDPGGPRPHAWLCSPLPGQDPAADLVALGALLSGCVGDGRDDVARQVGALGSALAAVAPRGPRTAEDALVALRRILGPGVGGPPGPGHGVPAGGGRPRRVAVPAAAAVAAVVLLAGGVAAPFVIGDDEPTPAPGTGSAPTGRTTSAPVGSDLDGDDLGDVLLYRLEGLRSSVAEFRSDGSRLTGPSLVGGPAAILLAGDVDGDGRTDLVRSVNTSTVSAVEVTLATGAERSGTLAYRRDELPSLADLDGDGRDDHLALVPATSGRLGLRVALSEDDGAPGELTEVELPELTTGSLVAGDLDGDGAAELLHLAPDRLEAGFLAATVLDRDDAAAPYEAVTAPTRFAGEVEHLTPGDVDGDGAEEVVVREAGTEPGEIEVTVIDLDDRGDRPELSTSSWFTGEVGASRSLDGFEPALADVDGDGLADLVQPVPVDGGLLLRVLGSDGDSLTDRGAWGGWRCGRCPQTFTALH